MRMMVGTLALASLAVLIATAIPAGAEPCALAVEHGCRIAVNRNAGWTLQSCSRHNNCAAIWDATPISAPTGKPDKAKGK
jgi:hypothetical protein